MELWLFDHSTNTRTTLSVESNGAPITIGRDETNTIVLRSPFVAKQHARIVQRGNQLFVEAISQSGTRLANRDLFPGTGDQPGAGAKLDFGDEIQIGQFSISPIRRSAAGTSTQAITEAERQATLMAYEQQIHAALLERMNLRITGNVSKTDPRFLEQINVNLDDLLSQSIGQLDPAVIEHTVRQHTHRLVIAEVVRQCQGRLQTDYRAAEQALDAQQEQAVTELVTSIVDMMPLLFDPAAVKEDIASAEDAFDALFDEHYRSLGPDLKQYLVRRTVAKDILDILTGLGPLQDLLEMPSVSEIMVVGKDRIYIEKNGVIQPTTRSFFSDEVLLSIIERILTPVGRRVDTSTPLVDARLQDGSRVNVVINPLSLVGPCLTIRKFGWVPFAMDDLIERGSIGPKAAAFLQGCVLGRKNIVICGGTGSGKTTMLNVLSAYCRPNERIVTVEESAELQLPQPHVVRMEGRPANIEGKGAYTIRDLVRNSLRMRPDRIIIGEVRGAEAMDMLQAMNTGHDGSLTTLHANSPFDAMKRLEALVLMAVDMPIRAIREQITTALDLVVQITRYADGTRRVSQISQVTDIDRDNDEILLSDIFTLKSPKQKELRPTGYLPTFAEDLVEQGSLGVDVFL